MAPWLIGITIACYAGTGIEKIISGQPAWGVFWLSYAMANVAYLLATK